MKNQLRQSQSLEFLQMVYAIVLARCPIMIVT